MHAASRTGRAIGETRLGSDRSALRYFTDCVGTAWTVYEIHPTELEGRAGLFFPHPERRGGWLLFESTEAERRRLAPFPTDWRGVTDFELERWCMRATPVVDLPKRRLGD